MIKDVNIVDVEKVWLTRRAAAEYLGVSISYVKKLCLNAKLKSYKVEGLVFIRRDELDRFIMGHDTLKAV